MNADRSLLFGLAAVQSGRLDASRLVEAGTAWMAEREGSFPEFLTRRGWLTDDDVSTIEASIPHDDDDLPFDRADGPFEDEGPSTFGEDDLDPLGGWRPSGDDPHG